MKTRNSLIALAFVLAFTPVATTAQTKKAAPQTKKTATQPPKATPAIPRDKALEARVEQTLARMTLDEKIGQMLELNLDIMGRLDQNRQWQLNETMLDTTIARYKIGSILNAPGTRAATIDQWQRWIRLIQQKSMQHIGIPDVYGLDHNHGVTYTQGGTLFPQPINLAASFNTDLAREGARITAYESRAGNCPWVYNPVLDLGRDPRWSRIWESFGEDPLVNARMAEAEIRGYQGDDPNHLGPYNVATSVKHYFAYGAPWTGKDRTPAYLSPQMLREKYFEPFRAAIRAGALTIMVNSGSINGTPVHASYEYLTKWLKEDLQWDGMIITDWADINNLYQRERVAKDKKDAIRIAINAGIDMSMDPYSVDFCTLLRQLVDEGKVSRERIDDAARRIIRLKYRLGLFDQPNTGPEGYEKFGSADHTAAALRAAEESIVLLRNDTIIVPNRPVRKPMEVEPVKRRKIGRNQTEPVIDEVPLVLEEMHPMLPLKKDTRILLTGPNANQMRCLNGGWSYTWQGSGAEDLAEKYNTIYEALCLKFGKDNVNLQQAVTYNERGQYWDERVDNEQLLVDNGRFTVKQGSALADGIEACDVIVACIGENSYCETPGNLTDLTLSENQRALVKALAKSKKPIVLVLNEGRPRIIADIERMANAVVHVLLPGNYGGDALANLLCGDANFSGRLPYTYPREINSLNNYDYKVSEEVGTMAGAYNYDARVSLQWPFGYGLSYTRFEYSNLRVDRTDFRADDVLTVSVDVKNVGSRAGKESVLLYSSDLIASIVPDNRRLRDFTKISLEPGEQQTVTFRLPANRLAFVGEDCRWRLEEGEFRLKVGNQTTLIRCQETRLWDEPNIF